MIGCISIETCSNIYCKSYFFFKVKKLAFICFSSSRMNQKQETYIQEVASLLTKLFGANRALLQRHGKNDFVTCYSCSFVIPC